MTAQMYLNQHRLRFKQLMADSRIRQGVKLTLSAGAGFFLSAASLAGAPQPFAMGLTAALSGWQTVAAALGSMAGYGIFWGYGGLQGLAWSAFACAAALTLGRRRIAQDEPLLMPALAALWVAASGLAFQMWGVEDSPISRYLLRVGLGAASVWLFARVGKDAMVDWTAQALFVLALSQAAPVPWLNLGCIAAAALSLREAFPASAMAGLALDLAGVSSTPMTAALCAVYLTRMIPAIPGWARQSSPALVYLAVMGLTGSGDWYPVLPFVLGGAVSVLLPQRPEVSHRRGETGLAQVRLEMMAGVLSQTQQLLLENPAAPIDEEALVCHAKELACVGCPNRRTCKNDFSLPPSLLHKPLYDPSVIPTQCRKPGRMIQELRRGQEQYRALRAGHDRQREYRRAVVQQYQFLADYLRGLSDQLARRGEPIQQRYQAEAAVASAGKEADNGDKCLCFCGTGCRYYVLLCDGMGTGYGAAQEGKTAADMLRQMLTAGFPAEYALRSLNSLLILRGWAGAVTVDLAEIRLDTGRGAVYKWGASPSYLLTAAGAEKIGTAGPPPGLGDVRESVVRLSLRRGETLILLSDGVDGEAVARAGRIDPGEPPGEAAARLLEEGGSGAQDDATVAVVRLRTGNLTAS